ncbi:disintegrin and metalloproteinase domain-containing protein 10-like [Orbicella faveolata]|uniref:disintegrin and metalloproteinase domain-containing protein 10-like n=1 Tax=Orbicella faveolata TaxID=48498 RepID=UPI0009E1F360|nr:disintegrin and metalloproteinase domain-containing protein 10-like [Orbicella faveolata]
MIAVRVCFASFVLLWSCAWSYRRPLGDFINHYETLDYDTTAVLREHGRVRRSSPNSDHRIELNLKTHQREFKIRLKRDTDLFTDDFRVENAEFDPAKVVAGDVEGHKNSFVHGFISDDGVFEGKIHVGNDEYFVESAKEYFKDAPKDFHSVIYESRDVQYPHAYGAGCGVNEKAKRWMDEVKRSAVSGQVIEGEHVTKSEPVLNRYRRAPGDLNPNKLSCTLKMRADHLFTENMAGGNKERALLLMADHVKAANAIYKNTDFNGDGKFEGIQFQIQRMQANDSSDTEVADNPYKDNNIGVEKLLELNSEENHDDVCLSYIFTYRDFADGVLGLAWVGEKGGAAGGICEKATTFRDGKKKSLNTGVVTFINYNKKVTQKVSQITFAHETGHNFGSPHDSTSNCAPGGSEGNYIMFARATSGDQRNNRLFSPCSREKMNGVMDVKGRCIEAKCCFQDAEGAICGNKVVEEGEECDCGYVEDKSCEEDVCCMGRNKTDGCTRMPGKNCSPSQGLCCSEVCTPRNASFLCLNSTECANTSYCDGTNATCPAPAPKANLTECNNGRQVCISGECSGSICLRYNLLECQCEQEDHLCDVCCKDGENGECKPTADIDAMKELELKQFPGAPCDNFNGYCDVFLKCRAVDADGPLSRLKDKFFSKEAILGYFEWIKQHWWAVVLMGLGLILLMAGFIKLCSVHTPSSNPNRKPARQLTLRRQSQQARNQRNPRNRQNANNRGNPRHAQDLDDPPPYPGAPMEMHGARR